MTYADTDLADLRGLSLRQPYADLMALDLKCVETRGKDIGAQPGQLLAIHASLLGFPVSECPDAWRRIPFPTPGGQIVAVHRVLAVFRTRRLTDGTVVNLCVRGDLKSLARVCGGRWGEEQAHGDWRPGRFLIVCERVARLRAPVPCRGMLGLWRVPEPTIAAVRDGLTP